MPYPQLSQLTASQASLYTAEQTRLLDKLTVEQQDISGFELMKKAARAAYRTLRRQWPEAEHLCICCGPGNNGGDGLVMAAMATEAGQVVSVLMVGGDAAIARLTGAALDAYHMAQAAGVDVQAFAGELPDEVDVIVDALLGTGLQGDVRGDYVQAITLINQASAAVMSVDIPSGLCSDTGAVLGVAVRADLTLSFIGLKRGLLTNQGTEHTGLLYFANLDVRPRIYEQVPSTVALITPDLMLKALPARHRNAHKGNFGHVLVVGGDQGMGGAALMASEAAVRSGAGLVSLATRAEHVVSSHARCPEVMAHAVQSGHELQQLCEQARVVVIGPGLGQSAWGQQMLQAVEAISRVKPEIMMVWDADALNLLAAKTNPEPSPNRVLTPHPGEAARLLGMGTAAVQADRFAAVNLLQTRYGGVVLLKGAGTLISDGVATAVSQGGNPGMASGGMGDVLSGILGAMLAQRSALGLSMQQATAVAVQLHASAADLCAKARGERGMKATNLLDYLPPLLNPTIATDPLLP